jgi:DNA polymerase elongation subunit (family B)
MYFATEFEMLMSFFDQAFRKMALVTGWNVIEYDWSYLINRAELIGIDPTIASPTGKLHGKFRLPMHKIVVDYLEIYKKWDRKVDVKESNTLDWVSEEVLGINKIHYNGSLSDLYTNDFESFVFYNAVDSLLVKYIDIELNVLMPYLQLSNITKTEHHRAFSPVAMLENVLVVELTKL